MTSSLRHAALIAFAYLIWSTWGVFVRDLTLDPRLITFYVGAVACVLALILHMVKAAVSSERVCASFLPPPHPKALFVIGSVFAINNVTFFWSMQLTTIANAVFAHYLAPVMVAALAPLVIGEPRFRSAPLALALATVGMALLMPGVGTELGGTHLFGIGVGAGGALAYAFMILLARKYSVRVPMLAWIFHTNIVLCLWLAPWALSLPLPSGRQWWMLLMLGTVHSVFAACCYLLGIRRVRAQVASVLGYLEPMGAVTLAAIFLAELPGPLILVGGALILLGGYFTVRADTADKLEYTT